tara:strand:- start:97 stop:543 length:447 start_codon:yes stop_codon:yes gene_type:complete
MELVNRKQRKSENMVGFEEILFNCFKDNLFPRTDCQSVSGQKNFFSHWVVIKCDFTDMPSFEVVEPQPRDICDPALSPAIYIQYSKFYSVRYGEISEIRMFDQNALHGSEPFHTIGCYEDKFLETVLNMDQDDGQNFARHLFNFLKIR